MKKDNKIALIVWVIIIVVVILSVAAYNRSTLFCKYVTKYKTESRILKCSKARKRWKVWANTRILYRYFKRKLKRFQYSQYGHKVDRVKICTHIRNYLFNNQKETSWLGCKQKKTKWNNNETLSREIKTFGSLKYLKRI